MPFYFYQIHSLLIKSSLVFPELLCVETTTFDIEIIEGEANNHPLRQSKHDAVIGESHSVGIKYEVTNAYTFLMIEGVVSFLIILSEKKVIYQRLDALDDDTLNLYITGTCLAFILMLKGIFPIHGSAIETSKGVVIFVGNSGLGKSTLAGKFLIEGHRILGDDVCVLTIDNDSTIMAFPSAQRIKLWDDSAEILAFKESDLIPIMEGWEKRQLLITNADRLNMPQNVIANYELSPQETYHFEIQELKGNDKLQVLLNNTYRVEAVLILKKEKEQFRFCAEIAQRLPLKRITRPIGRFELDKMYQLLMTDINHSNN